MDNFLVLSLTSAALPAAARAADRPDSKIGGQVVGVTVENHNLRPGESTNVFVIRRGAER